MREVELRARLAAQPGELETLVAGIREELLDRAPAPPHWTIRSYLHHLADSALVWALRVRTLAARDGAVLPAYDFHEWQRTLGYQERPVADALRTFRALRESTLRLLDVLPEPAWGHSGQHEHQGALDLAVLLRGHHEDAAGHLEDIRAVLEEVSRST